MAVLSCVASAPNIEDPSKRFIVTGRNVQQAAKIIKRTYVSLVDWVELHTKRAKQSSIAEISLKNNFFNAFKELKESSDDGLVNKGDLFNLVGQKVGKSNMQVSRDWKKISNLFVETKDGRKKFVEIREGAEE